MLLSAVSVLVVAQSSSEIPEELMNNPVLHIRSVSVDLVVQRACVLLYCHLLPIRLYRILPHYLINGMISGKKESYLTRNVCFDSLYDLRNIQRRTQRYIIINVYRNSCSYITRNSCRI